MQNSVSLPVYSQRRAQLAFLPSYLSEPSSKMSSLASGSFWTMQNGMQRSPSSSPSS